MATFRAFEKEWECKISGILGEVGVSTLNFLGLTIALKDGILIIHQKDYILSKLKKLAMLSGRGRHSLPDISEGRTPPVPMGERTSKEYLKVLRMCQEQTGTLRWLAMKSRPDIEAAVSVCASLQTHAPNEAFRYLLDIWKYLATTYGYVMKIEPNKKENSLAVATDASFASGGSKSRTGIVISLMGVTVQWVSRKQDLTALSTAEAELEAMKTGLQYGLQVRRLVGELLEQPVGLRMIGDNMAAIRQAKFEITNWRTQHYCLTMSWIRDYLIKECVDLKHMKGEDLVADGLTKILGRVILARIRDQLGLEVL